MTMAQPDSNNARYFSHDADMRNDIKIKALRKKFGHTGYALWCFILESLTDSNNFEIEYFNDINKELYASDFDTDSETLTQVIEFCVRIGLLQVRGSYVFSDAHKRRFQKLERSHLNKRKAGILGMQKRWGKSITEDNAVITEDNGHITDDSKREEKGKEEKRKEKKENIEIPYKEIIALWNSICLSLPKVKTLNDNRRMKIRCRLTESGCKTADQMTAWAKEIFSLCQSSDFLRGENKSQWTATFDWVFENSTNWVKVSEGNYANDRGSVRGSVASQQKLGAGEYLTPDGRRTYGSGRANIPLSAPPRPSDRHQWSAETNNWIVL